MTENGFDIELGATDSSIPSSKTPAEETKTQESSKGPGAPPAPPPEQKPAAPPSAMAAAQEFPKAGVKFSWIVDEFIPVICGGIDAIKDMTTDEVLQNFTKNPTAKYKCSYCHKLQRENHWAYRAEANAFVSHAFTYKFLDAVAALEEHFKDDRDEAVVWWDLFSINQHIDNDWSIDWLKTTFKSAIQDIGRVVMVMSPWNRPVTFERAWCVFEVYRAIDTGADFQIALSQEDRDKFVKDLLEQESQAMHSMLVEVRAEKSKCRDEHDRVKLHEAIQQNGMSFDRLNGLLFSRYRDWVVQVVSEVLTQTRDRMGEDHPDTIAVMEELAGIHSNRGDYAKAEPLYEACFQKKKVGLGQDHIQTLESMNKLATMYRFQGMQSKAETLLEAYLHHLIAHLEKRTAVLGEDHPETLATMHNLGTAYNDFEKYAKTEPLLEACFKKRTAVLGEDHPDTLETMDNLGETYYYLKKYGKAEPLLEARFGNTILGVDHPDTFGEYSYNTLATMFHHSTLATMFHVEFDCTGNHPSALHPMFHLGIVYTELKKYAKAEPLFEACFKNWAVTIGEDHPDTLKTMHILGYTCVELKKYGKAEPLLEACLTKMTVTYGEDHPNTLATMQNLGETCLNLKKYGKAEFLLEACLTKMTVTDSEDHPDTLATMQNLGETCLNLKKYGKAEFLLEACFKKRTVTMKIILIL